MFEALLKVVIPLVTVFVFKIFGKVSDAVDDALIACVLIVLLSVVTPDTVIVVAINVSDIDTLAKVEIPETLKLVAVNVPATFAV